MSAPRPLLGVLFIALANALGGVSFVMQKVALEGLEPGMIAALRHLIALPPILVWARLRGARLSSFSRGELVRLACLGTFAFGLPMLLGIIGVGLASASNGAILVLIEPVTILLLAWALLGERIGGLKILGVFLGMVGALFIVLETTSTEGLFQGDAFLGNVILVVHALLWGLYTPLVRPLSQRRDALAISAWTLLFSLILLVPYAGWELRTWEPNEALGSALLWTAALGIGVSFASTVLWVAAVRHLEASKIAPFIFVQPLVGVLVGVLWLGESLSTPAVVGSVLVALGCALAVRSGGGGAE